jgi:magnesium transporter
MLFAYTPRGSSLERTAPETAAALPEGTVWFDLVSPTPVEERMVEDRLGLEIPMREEMAKIEPSSRLYIENGARYMTATLVFDAETERPKTPVVTFILVNGKLVTVRYDEPRPFARVTTKLGRACPMGVTGEGVLIELLDAVIDRSADILERVGAEVDEVSRRIFEGRAARNDPNHGYQTILRTIGRKGDLTSKIRESLVSIGRLVLFLANEADNIKLEKDQRAGEKHGARRAVAHRPLELPDQQDPVPARCGGRHGEHGAKQRHQDFFGGRGRDDAADADRVDLRHELQAHAGARMGCRLSAGADRDDHRGDRALSLFQMEEVALSRRLQG